MFALRSPPAAFDGWVGQTVQALAPCCGHRNAALRSAALQSLGQITRFLHQHYAPPCEWTRGDAANSPVSEEAMTLADIVMPLAIGALLSDYFSDCAITGATLGGDLLELIGPRLLEAHSERILYVVGKVCEGKVQCQHAQDAYDDDDDEDEAARDEDLLDQSWDWLVRCAKVRRHRTNELATDPFFLFVQVGSPEYAGEVMREFVPRLLKFMKSKYPESYGALALGTAGELVRLSAPGAGEPSDRLLAACIDACSRDDETMCVNGSFGIGVLFARGGVPRERIVETLMALQPLFGESGKMWAARCFCNILSATRRTRDNACGAVGCLLSSELCDGLPLEQLLPVFLGALPIGEDTTEKANAYGGLMAVAQRDLGLLVGSAGDVARIAVHELGTDTNTQAAKLVYSTHIAAGNDIDEEIGQHFVDLLRSLSQNPQAMQGMQQYINQVNFALKMFFF